MDISSTIITWITGGGVIVIVIFAIATYVRVDKQIGRVYCRLDEKTDKLKEETQDIKVCNITHKNVDATLKEVKENVKCIPDIKAGIDLLLRKNGLKND